METEEMNPVIKKYQTFDDTAQEAVITTIFQDGRIITIRKPRLEYEQKIQTERDRQVQWKSKIS